MNCGGRVSALSDVSGRRRNRFMVGDMAYEKFVGDTLEYDLCSYEGSKLFFRGPRRDLKKPYIAFLGGDGYFRQVPGAPVSSAGGAGA
ncbi:DUF6473 family protein [Roseovarius faecimaris]|uniref:DUF6473 family protein n=1 Tax=Roseovarius faecimaris TaxID=2494550 RepID=UPI0031B58FAA